MSSLRLAGLGLGLAMGMASAAFAQGLVPPGFFDRVPPGTGGQAAIEADILSYDGRTQTISAEGGVVMVYEGYTARGDRVVYNQGSGEVRLVGNVVVLDPDGNRYEADSVEVTGGMRQAFLRSLTITTADGARITAEDVRYADALETILTEATYSPCGLCIDSKGRRIGWSVKAARIVYDRENATIALDEPQLSLLGVPVAWLPFLVLPDPSQPRLTGFRTPQIAFDEQTGASLEVPYAVALGADTDLVFSPRLMSRQGLLLGAEVVHRFAFGEVDAKAHGVYQLDPDAFAGELGDREWRGAIQTSGRFTPAETWTAGWTHTAFSDAGFLPDYRLSEDDYVVNEIYATHLSRDHYLDARVQDFLLLGEDVSGADQAGQGRALPVIRGASVTDLPDGWGQLRLNGRLLAVDRSADHIVTANGVDYVLGHEGRKVHVALEGAWQNQYVVPGGVLATPYLGLRADAASYDGAGGDFSGSEVSLLEATPIAAIDVRWPLVARNGLDSHLLEPIAQLAYRGSATSPVGITNDDAQSFVFDDTNLFSYNRFSGFDRQETGLRATLGGRYLANFADGTWLELIGGQSFHLAGENAFAEADPALTGVGSGLAGDASYIVLGARGAPVAGTMLGAKVQLDPADARIARAGLGAAYERDGYAAGVDYLYRPADSALGQDEDQHEIAGRVGAPLPIDYWRATAGLAWDLSAQTWLEANAGLVYDDGYLEFGAEGTITGPTHRTPDDLRYTVNFRLKSPSGDVLGF
ncbi:LPS-assembly protein LptD [Arsenicitalea aurantiaca]|uniref:LPS-assembly protein LptD n=1 Tax=Arsenicitalea aurantiaca TaxID=1783274 RepID=UPI001315907B|nr:LPS assembly protein LptD [Arsenicitalea aurantiaca]